MLSPWAWTRFSHNLGEQPPHLFAPFPSRACFRPQSSSVPTHIPWLPHLRRGSLDLRPGNLLQCSTGEELVTCLPMFLRWCDKYGPGCAAPLQSAPGPSYIVGLLQQLQAVLPLVHSTMLLSLPLRVSSSSTYLMLVSSSPPQPASSSSGIHQWDNWQQQ